MVSTSKTLKSSKIINNIQVLSRTLNWIEWRHIGSKHVYFTPVWEFKGRFPNVLDGQKSL